MPRPLLPPRGLFISTRVLFNNQLPFCLKETLLMLMALTWSSPHHKTPLITYKLLEQLTGKPKRTLRGHLADLRTYQAVLRLQYAEAGQFIIELAPWLFVQAAEKSGEKPVEGVSEQGGGEIPPLPVKEEEEYSELTDSKDSLLLLYSVHDHNAAERQKTAKNAPPEAQKTAPTAPPKTLSKALTARLVKAGVFPALLDEIAARAAQGRYSARDLAALLAWVEEDQPQNPAPLFVARLRAGARAPRVYFEPACPRCGKRGGHAQDCPRRYLFEG